MNICLQTINTLAVVFAPFCPQASEHMQRMIGREPNTGAPGRGLVGTDAWMHSSEHVLQAEQPLGEPVILFTKIENETVEQEIAKLGESEPVVDDLISIDDFAKVKLRTGVVLEAERIAKSEKLLKLQVDLGTEKRQILAGIAKHYAPEDLVGKTIVVVANLKPAKLMGHESQGMVLAASNADGVLTLVQPGNSEVGPGAEVR
jgi:methionyl-tRNA synthetase